MNFERNPNSNTGLSSPDEPVFVIIGKFRKPHGIRGEIRMTVITNFPELINQGQKIYVGQNYQAYTIKSLRWQGEDLLVSLEEMPDRTAVEIFRNVMVHMKSEDMPEPPEGEFYLHQLVGLEVITDQGQNLGILKEVLLTGANDVYLVSTPDGKEILLPAIQEVVLDVNMEDRKMLVHILPGLLD